MKKPFTLFGVVFLLSVSGLKANQKGNVGIGVLLGQPLGPTLKVWRTATQAFNFGLGFNDDFAAYADYSWHSWELFAKPDQGDLAGYVSLGGKIEDEDGKDDAVFGIRTLAGVTYFLPQNPIELYLEVGPVFELSPDTDVDIDGGIGIRFYFGK